MNQQSSSFQDAMEDLNPANTDTGASRDAVPEVSEKDTKAEILGAYKSLVKTYKENVRAKKTDRAKQSADAEIVQKAGAYTVDGVLRAIDTVKMDVASALSQLAEKLSAEAKKLGDIDRAIAVEQKKLKDLYDLDAAAVRLEDLVRAHEAERDEFRAESEKMQQQRKREQEEYEYNLKQQRKREEEQRKEREDALLRRENEWKQREAEILELRKKAERFPAELESAIAKAKSEAAEAAKREYEIRAEIAGKETAGDRKVMEAKIQFLQELVGANKEEIASLKRELENATRQVQSIAEKSIEGSAGKQTLKAVSDIALQQAGRRPDQR